MSDKDQSSTQDNIVNPDASSALGTNQSADSSNELVDATIQESANDTDSSSEMVTISSEPAVEAQKDSKERFKIDVGDTIVVEYKIIEGKKSRIQPYEGIVIAKKGSGVSKTITVRRVGVAGIGVERIFPVFSPNILNIKVKSKSKVRRAKLYYIRQRTGKAASKL